MMNFKKIDTLEHINRLFKNVITERVSKSKIKVSYKTTNKLAVPKPMVLPTSINLDENFVEGIGLYIGDGKLTPNDTNHLEFSTVDKDMAQFFWKFLTNRLNLTIRNCSLSIRYRYGEGNQLKEVWSKLLGIPQKKLVLRIKDIYEMQDSLTIQVNSIIIRKLFKSIIDNGLPSIKENKILRRAFLRGEFAADGKFGKEKDTNTYYVSEVTFCYDAKKEVWLRDFIIECLELEGINRYNQIPGYIRITGWDNYIKFWNMRLFDLCERKKNKLLGIIKQSNVHFRINKQVLHSLLKSLNMTTGQLTDLLGLHRTNLKRVKEGEQLLKLEQIYTIMKRAGLKWNYIIKHTENIRMGKLTHLKPERKFIEFLINEKNLN